MNKKFGHLDLPQLEDAQADDAAGVPVIGCPPGRSATASHPLQACIISPVLLALLSPFSNSSLSPPYFFHHRLIHICRFHSFIWVSRSFRALVAHHEDLLARSFGAAGLCLRRGSQA